MSLFKSREVLDVECVSSTVLHVLLAHSFPTVEFLLYSMPKYGYVSLASSHTFAKREGFSDTHQTAECMIHHILQLIELPNWGKNKPIKCQNVSMF